MRPLALQHRSFINATFAVPEPQTLGAGRQCRPPVPAGERPPLLSAETTFRNPTSLNTPSRWNLCSVIYKNRLAEADS